MTGRAFRPGERPNQSPHMELELGARARAHEDDRLHGGLEVLRQPVHHERQDVRAERVADEDGPVLLPSRKIAPQDPARGLKPPLPGSVLFQKYLRELRATTDTPAAASSFERPRSATAQPPSPVSRTPRISRAVPFGRHFDEGQVLEALDSGLILDRRRARDAAEGLLELGHPALLVHEAVTDLGKHHDLGVPCLADEVLGRGGSADLVLQALESDPGDLESGRGQEDEFARLGPRLPFEPAPLAEGLGQDEVGTEPETDRASELRRRGLDEQGIDEGRA